MPETIFEIENYRNLGFLFIQFKWKELYFKNDYIFNYNDYISNIIIYL